MTREEEIVAAIADDIIALASGDHRKAQVIAAAYLPADVRGFGEATTPDPPWYGQTDYAEDWK